MAKSGKHPRFFKKIKLSRSLGLKFGAIALVAVAGTYIYFNRAAADVQTLKWGDIPKATAEDKARLSTATIEIDPEDREQPPLADGKECLNVTIKFKTVDPTSSNEVDFTDEYARADLPYGLGVSEDGNNPVKSSFYTVTGDGTANWCLTSTSAMKDRVFKVSYARMTSKNAQIKVTFNKATSAEDAKKADLKGAVLADTDFDGAATDTDPSGHTGYISDDPENGIKVTARLTKADGGSLSGADINVIAPTNVKTTDKTNKYTTDDNGTITFTLVASKAIVKKAFKLQLADMSSKVFSPEDFKINFVLSPEAAAAAAKKAALSTAKMTEVEYESGYEADSNGQTGYAANPSLEGDDIKEGVTVSAHFVDKEGGDLSNVQLTVTAPSGAFINSHDTKVKGGIFTDDNGNAKWDVYSSKAFSNRSGKVQFTDSTSKTFAYKVSFINYVDKQAATRAAHEGNLKDSKVDSADFSSRNKSDPTGRTGYATGKDEDGITITAHFVLKDGSTDITKEPLTITAPVGAWLTEDKKTSIDVETSADGVVTWKVMSDKVLTEKQGKIQYKNLPTKYFNYKVSFVEWTSADQIQHDPHLNDLQNSTISFEFDKDGDIQNGLATGRTEEGIHVVANFKKQDNNPLANEKFSIQFPTGASGKILKQDSVKNCKWYEFGNCDPTITTRAENLNAGGTYTTNADGQFEFYVISTKSIDNKDVVIKYSLLPIKTGAFKVAFTTGERAITDKSILENDKFNFKAQIPAWMISNVKRATVTYTYELKWTQHSICSTCSAGLHGKDESKKTVEGEKYGKDIVLGDGQTYSLLMDTRSGFAPQQVPAYPARNRGVPAFTVPEDIFRYVSHGEAEWITADSVKRTVTKYEFIFELKDGSAPVTLEVKPTQPAASSSTTTSATSANATATGDVIKVAGS